MLESSFHSNLDALVRLQMRYKVCIAFDPFRSPVSLATLYLLV